MIPNAKFDCPRLANGKDWRFGISTPQNSIATPLIDRTVKSYSGICLLIFFGGLLSDNSKGFVHFRSSLQICWFSDKLLWNHCHIAVSQPIIACFKMNCINLAGKRKSKPSNYLAITLNWDVPAKMIQLKSVSVYSIYIYIIISSFYP